MPLKLKTAGLRLRVEPELREEFVEACRTEGRAAAQVLRDFMRRYRPFKHSMPGTRPSR